MSQPVKLSDALVLDARLTGELSERSISGQIEDRANLGRAIEPLLQGAAALALCRSAGTRPLSECLESVESPGGHQRVRDYLQTQPYPHFEAHPSRAGWLVRIDADGTRTIGRFVNREFRPVKASRHR